MIYAKARDIGEHHSYEIDILFLTITIITVSVVSCLFTSHFNATTV